MWLSWLPWRFVVSKVARAQGFLDPISILSSIHRFAQPAEVAQPNELLRAGVVMHARGLINTQAIQHNLDWIWPYWVEKQFNPQDESFIPRAFSVTHINLTHRNWTAVGLPGLEAMPIVDPRGLLTPLLDQWSLDFWINKTAGETLLPSRSHEAQQQLEFASGLSISTTIRDSDSSVTSCVWVESRTDGNFCVVELTCSSAIAADLIVSIRPYNPEGISFIHDINVSEDLNHWQVNGERSLSINKKAQRVAFSTYRQGDVYLKLDSTLSERECICNVGLATAAAFYPVKPNEPQLLRLEIPLDLGKAPRKTVDNNSSWESQLKDSCHFSAPDSRYEFLFEAALRTVILLSPNEVYPGPYTYKRFWFRDAAFMLNALLCANNWQIVEHAINASLHRQTRQGYFLSQEGEWDSNGEALWIIWRFCQLTARKPNAKWVSAVSAGADWIIKKRSYNKFASPYPGLFPAGFSAEHFGPVDYYYWDNFWGVAGLRAAAKIFDSLGQREKSIKYENEAETFLVDIENVINKSRLSLGIQAIPAAPQRRLDSAAVGSLVASYPLDIWPASHPLISGTAQYLLENCLIQGGFFQDMIHSGINPYLTLHLSQVLLSMGDANFAKLMHSAASFASPTGQWPEAVHPRTKGGCMGDGQHGWAAAEWMMIVRNCFVKEVDDGLMLCAGITDDIVGSVVTFGPTLTPYGVISLKVERHTDHLTVAWKGDWRGEVPKIKIAVPGHEVVIPKRGESSLNVKRVTL